MNDSAVAATPFCTAHGAGSLWRFDSAQEDKANCDDGSDDEQLPHTGLALKPKHRS